VKPQYARFALALIGVTVGAHLNLRRLRNAGRRQMLLLVAEALLIPAGVVLALSLWTDAPPAIVLSSVTLSEILGPLATRIALLRSGEIGGDRPRLLDFLQEENVLLDLEARSIEDAIERLTTFPIRSHHLQVDRDALVKSVRQREAQVSTCVGGGLAVPHGSLSEGRRMVGVIGISRKGLPFETPDGEPLHCIVLLATPHGERVRHLAVLAALARRIGTNPAVQQELYGAKSAAHVCEVLHDHDDELDYVLARDA